MTRKLLCRLVLLVGIVGLTSIVSSQDQNKPSESPKQVATDSAAATPTKADGDYVGSKYA